MSIFDDIASATDDVLSYVLRPVRSLVRKGLHVVAGWTSNVFHDVGSAWDDLSSAAHTLEHGIGVFATNSYHALAHLVTVTIPDTVRWAARELAHLGDALGSWVAAFARDLAHAVDKAWHDLQAGLSWFYDHVVVPIERRVAAAEHYLAHEVHDVVELVLHPTRLVQVLADATFAAVPTVAVEVGTPLARWLRRSAVRDVTDVAHEVEAILSAVL